MIAMTGEEGWKVNNAMSFRLFKPSSSFDRGRGFGNGSFPSVAACPSCGQTLTITPTDRPGWVRAECRNHACELARTIRSGSVGDGEVPAVRALREAWFDQTTP